MILYRHESVCTCGLLFHDLWSGQIGRSSRRCVHGLRFKPRWIYFFSFQAWFVSMVSSSPLLDFFCGGGGGEGRGAAFSRNGPVTWKPSEVQVWANRKWTNIFALTTRQTWWSTFVSLTSFPSAGFPATGPMSATGRLTAVNRIDVFS